VRKKKIKAFSTYVNDYPEFMALYEKESLAAEAILAAEKKPKRNQLRKNAASKTTNGKRRSS